jgi:hypothetical protein
MLSEKLPSAFLGSLQRGKAIDQMLAKVRAIGGYDFVHGGFSSDVRREEKRWCLGQSSFSHARHHPFKQIMYQLPWNCRAGLAEPAGPYPPR